MRMISKFNGTCRLCSGPIVKGSPIIWTRNDGAQHERVDACVAAVEFKIAQEAMQPVVVRDVVKVTAGSVTAFLTAATAYIKSPKVRFLAPNGGELRLSLAAGNTKYPGAVQVKVDGTWVGRIGADGVLTPNLARDQKMVDALSAIAADPAGAAKAYGALMARCSFCAKTLTDEGSVKAGYGPICAQHYGLPHTALGTPEVATPVAARVRGSLVALAMEMEAA